MNQLSLENEDFVFDVPIEVEESESLPNGKAAGHDGIMGKHLTFGGKNLTKQIQCYSCSGVYPCFFQDCQCRLVYKGKREIL